MCVTLQFFIFFIFCNLYQHIIEDNIVASLAGQPVFGGARNNSLVTLVDFA